MTTIQILGVAYYVFSAFYALSYGPPEEGKKWKITHTVLSMFLGRPLLPMSIGFIAGKIVKKLRAE